METNFGVKDNVMGHIAKDPGTETTACYPEMIFRGKHFDLLVKVLGTEPDVDDLIDDAKCGLKIKAISKGGYDGNSLTVCLLTMDGAEIGGEAETPEEDALESDPTNSTDTADEAPAVEVAVVSSKKAGKSANY